MNQNGLAHKTVSNMISRMHDAVPERFREKHAAAAAQERLQDTAADDSGMNPSLHVAPLMFVWLISPHFRCPDAHIPFGRIRINAYSQAPSWSFIAAVHNDIRLIRGMKRIQAHPCTYQRYCEDGGVLSR